MDMASLPLGEGFDGCSSGTPNEIRKRILVCLLADHIKLSDKLEARGC